MAYTYAGWINEADDAARLTMLRQHIAEVSTLINADVSADSRSVNHATLLQYHAGLLVQLEKYETINARTSGNTVHYARKR